MFPTVKFFSTILMMCLGATMLLPCVHGNVEQHVGAEACYDSACVPHPVAHDNCRDCQDALCAHDVSVRLINSSVTSPSLPAVSACERHVEPPVIAPLRFIAHQHAHPAILLVTSVQLLI